MSGNADNDNKTGSRETTNKPSAKRPVGIFIVGTLMILFGVAEIVTAFSHNFFGILTSPSMLSVIASAVIGSFYSLAGLFVLTLRRTGAIISIGLLVADILGRILLVIAGFFPTNTAENTFGIVAGTSIAGVFAIYIGLRWKSFK